MKPGKPLLSFLRQNNRLVVRIDCFPFWQSSQCCHQRSVWGKSDGSDSPLGKCTLPSIAPKVVDGGQVVHESVAIEIGPAIDVDAVIGIEFPNEISAPVVVVKHGSRRTVCRDE